MNRLDKSVVMILALFALAWFALNVAINKIFDLTINETHTS